MKRILKTAPPPTDFILEAQLPANPIIGTCPRQGLQTKGFIQKIHPRDEEAYQITLAYNLPEGVRYNPSLFGGTLQKALSHPDLDYFLFDSYALLYLWLAE